METKTIAETVQYPKRVVVQKAAEILRECVKYLINFYSVVLWPLIVEELQCDERKPPETLLLSKNKSETYSHFVDSYSSDIMFANSNGKYTTLKNILCCV